MITTGKEIYNILSGDSALENLVGINAAGKIKVYPLVIPANTELPCIVYERSFNNQNTKDGRALSDTVLTIAIITDDYDKGILIAEAVNNSLDMYSGGTIRRIQLLTGAESFDAKAFIQGLTYSVKSV